jgi:hypothetical protein
VTSHRSGVFVGRREVLFLVALITASSCGDHEHASPTSPTPPVEPPSQPPAQTWTLSGTVTETAPTALMRIAGATVMVFDSDTDTGRSATTDANGTFKITALHGSFAIRTVAPGYIENKLAVTLTGNQTVNVQLDPVFQVVTTTQAASISGGDMCPGGGWDYMRLGASPMDTSEPCFMDFRLDVHHDGTLTAALTWSNRETSPMVELYRSIGGQPSGDPLELEPEQNALTVRAEIYAHAQYILRVSESDQYGGSPPAGASPFTVTITHPN